MKNIRFCMKKVIPLFLVLFIVLSNFSSFRVNAMSPQEAIKTYEKDIIASARKTGVWASVTAAQLILESGNPMSDLATKDNNFFGIKWSEKHATRYPGAKAVEYNTKECYNGSYVTIKAKFTHFPTPKDGITEHSIIWWNGYYEPELKILENLNSTMDEFLREMGNGPYATDPNYYTKLRNIIDKNNLEELDKKAFPDGRKFCGFGDRKVGEYNYPDDGYNGEDVENVGTSVTNSNGTKSLIVKEEDLKGMYPQHFFSENAKDFELPDEDSLGSGDKYSVSIIKNEIMLEREYKSYNLIRTFAVFLGLCVVVYSLMLVVAYLFDKANNVFELSLVKIISFGKLSYSDEEEHKGKEGYLGKGNIVKVCSVCVIVGLLLISGAVYNWLAELLRWVWLKVG